MRLHTPRETLDFREVSAALFAGFGSGGGTGITPPPPPPSGSCVGRCGTQPDDSLDCGCDSACIGFGDCCDDYQAVCFDQPGPPACLDGGGVCAFDEDCMAGSCECRNGSMFSLGSDNLCVSGLCASTIELCLVMCADSGGLIRAEPWCQ